MSRAICTNDRIMHIARNPRQVHIARKVQKLHIPRNMYPNGQNAMLWPRLRLFFFTQGLSKTNPPDSMQPDVPCAHGSGIGPFGFGRFGSSETLLGLEPCTGAGATVRFPRACAAGA